MSWKRLERDSYPNRKSTGGETDLAEAVARNGHLSLTAYVYRALTAWFHNARLIGKVASQGKFDVIAGNETYEIPVTNFFGMRVLPTTIPFVMMYDFWGLEVTSGNMFEKVGAWLLNLVWSQEWRVTARGLNAAIFFGEIEDLPDRPFGVLLPNRRRYAESMSNSLVTLCSSMSKRFRIGTSCGESLDTAMDR